MKYRIIETADGSQSLFSNEVNDPFHSINGAVTESRHVFIQHGLTSVLKSFNQINILEIGFGTGLNAFLSLLEILKYPSSTVHYTGLDAFPIEAGILDKLNYGQFSDDKKSNQYYQDITHAGWKQLVRIHPNFHLHKIPANWIDWIPLSKYHLIYYDAFAPDKQPGLWKSVLFNKCYDLIETHGILTTYTAKGSVRRDMEKAGFTVNRLPGPPGKRHMLQAVKPG